MKKLLLAIALIVLLVSPAMAETTSGANWDTSSSFAQFFNHDHGYSVEDQRESPLGVGVDVVLYEYSGKPAAYGIESIEFQNKWDFANDEYSGYVVGKVNLFRMISKFVNK